jgi:hypothetical protein
VTGHGPTLEIWDKSACISWAEALGLIKHCDYGQKNASLNNDAFKVPQRMNASWVKRHNSRLRQHDAMSHCNDKAPITESPK